MLTNPRTFELLTLVSLLNKRNYLHVTDEDVQQVVKHVLNQEELDEDNFHTDLNNAVDYVSDNYPRLVEAASLLINVHDLNEDRYHTLINLFKKKHEIEAMVEKETATN